MTRTFLFVRKTVRDCARPKLLAAFLVPYVGLTVLLGVALAEGTPDDLDGAPLFTQEQVLLELYSQLSFVWLVAFPMVVVAVLAATVVAGEAERGTLRILLSKPVRRWEPLVGKFLGIVVFGLLTTVAGLLVGAAVLSVATGVSSMALGGGIGTLLPGTVLYALFVVVAVAALGTLLGVLSGSRLKTMLGTTLVPVLFFAFTFLRFLPAEDLYERYFLYVPDLSYHLGNVYLTLQGVVGPEFNPETQEAFATVSGVYDAGTAWRDPLLGGIVGSVPLSGYVSPTVSVAVVVVTSAALFAVAVVRFDRMDVQ